MTKPGRDGPVPAEGELPDRWERWWSAVDGTPGEIVWNADEADLEADLETFVPCLDPSLPLVDLGCGDGRQTRFLARHFTTVIGTDVSPSAIDRARAAGNPANVRYRVLDARHPDEAENCTASSVT